MNFANKGSIVVPRRLTPSSSDGSLAGAGGIVTVRGWPVFNRDTMNYNHVEKLKKINREQKGYNVVMVNNTVDARRRVSAGYITGVNDVDLIVMIYTQRPQWFEGGGKDVLMNRETVFNIALNVMSDNWANLLYRQVRENPEKSISFAELKVFNDVLKELNIIDGLPAHHLEYHRRALAAFYHENADPNCYDESEDYLIGEKYNEMKHGPLKKYIGVSEEEALKNSVTGSTYHFISSCIHKKGIGYLIQVLRLFYGSIAVDGHYNFEK